MTVETRLDVPDAPQIILDAHMLRSWYVPADPEAAAATVPAGLAPVAGSQIFINQYVVESEEHTSGLGPYELTYAGVNVASHDVGGFPAHWLHTYLNSSDVMREYTRRRGFPVGPGRTHLVLDGGAVTATTEVDGVPIIRTVARIGDRTAPLRGQIGYIAGDGGNLTLGRYPFVAEVADPVEIESITFLEPDHPLFALRPAEPLQIVFALYSPRISFAYPGGEESL